MTVEWKVTPYTFVDKNGRIRESTFGEVTKSVKFDGKDVEATENAWANVRRSFTWDGHLHACLETADGILARPDAGDPRTKGTLAWFGQTLKEQAKAQRERVDALTPDPKVQLALREAFALGCLFRAVIRRRDLEEDTVRGRNQTKRASEGGRARAKKLTAKLASTRKDWQSQAEAIWARNRKLSCLAVARLIAKKSGQSVHTIRRHLKKADR